MQLKPLMFAATAAVALLNPGFVTAQTPICNCDLCPASGCPLGESCVSVADYMTGLGNDTNALATLADTVLGLLGIPITVDPVTLPDLTGLANVTVSDSGFAFDVKIAQLTNSLDYSTSFAPFLFQPYPCSRRCKLGELSATQWNE